MAQDKESIYLNQEETKKKEFLLLSLRYVLMTYFISILRKVLLAIFIILGFWEIIENGALFFVFLLVLELFELLLNLFLIFKMRKQDFSLECFLLKCAEKTCYSLLWISLFLQQQQKISNDLLFIWAVPLVLVSIFVFLKNLDILSQIMYLKVLFVLESFQILFIFLNLSRDVKMPWILTQFYYYPKAILLLISSYFLFALLFIMACTMLCVRVGKGGCIFLSIVCYYSFSNYLYFWSFKGALEQAEAQTKLEYINFGRLITFQFYSTGLWIAFFSIPYLAFICYLIFRVDQYIGLITTQSKQITIKDFSEKLKLQVTQVGDNYFSFLKKFKNQGGTEQKVQECMICFDKNSEVLIKPCGHSGICKECMKNSL